MDSPSTGVARVTLNRPKKSNAMNRLFWKELPQCMDALAEDPGCRAILLVGAGRNFTSGLDIQDHMELLAPPESSDPARRAFELRKLILAYQRTFTSMETCLKPVIAAVHGACIGGGVDMISAADIRFCSADAYFCVKEVELGLAADVGTLQRMPKIMGNDSLVRELALTARNMEASEALTSGFVSKVCPDKDALLVAALETAQRIAAMSPVAVMGTKDNLNFAREHSTSSSLSYITAWNQGMLQSGDMTKVGQAMMAGKQPQFDDLD